MVRVARADPGADQRAAEMVPGGIEAAVPRSATSRPAPRSHARADDVVGGTGQRMFERPVAAAVADRHLVRAARPCIPLVPRAATARDRPRRWRCTHAYVTERG